MRTAVLTLVLVLVLSPAARGQDITMPANIEQLAAKASDAVNITIDGALLQLAANFLSSDRDEQGIKQLVSKIKGIYVRSFEFDRSGAYNEADLDSLRSQLKAPQWSRMASVRSQRQGENIDVYVKMDSNEIAGLTVIAAQPRELTVVNIVGAIDLDALARLSGQFGIPRLDLGRGRK
jgi:hypothetical protein